MVEAERDGMGSCRKCVKCDFDSARKEMALVAISFRNKENAKTRFLAEAFPKPFSVVSRKVLYGGWGRGRG